MIRLKTRHIPASPPWPDCEAVTAWRCDEHDTGATLNWPFSVYADAAHHLITRHGAPEQHPTHPGAPPCICGWTADHGAVYPNAESQHGAHHDRWLVTDWRPAT